MLNEKPQTINWERWLYVFIFIHITAWTVLPYLVRYNLPLDSIEGAVWGQQFEWGYDKNPFLNGWLTGIAAQLDDHTGWAIYLFSQLSVGACFWAVWELGKKILSPAYALVAVVLLEGIQYYNIHAIDFNDNTLELSLWALTALYFYNALKSQGFRDWVLAGIFAALGMMAKYYTLMLLLPMFIFMCVNPENRKSFKNPAFYLGILSFIVIVTPHIVWLFSHDFITVRYAFQRVTRPLWYNHFDFSGLFVWQQAETFLPILFLSIFLFLGRKPLLATPRIRLKPFDKEFLFYVGAGPFLLTVFISALTGIMLRAGWGVPLMSLWSLILIACIQPRITPDKFYRFISVFYVLLTVTLLTYAEKVIHPDETSSANYPGKMLARTLTHQWHQTYHTPLTYVAGSRWIAGNIAFYSQDHPRVYINWDSTLSPWVDENNLQNRGGIFIWDMAQDHEKTQQEILKRFPKMGNVEIMHYAWMRNPKAKPVEIAVAFLPPNAF
jgi:4-amino-4-deoxy-L-arabinose transferase-like glycosyltransferase